MTDPLTPPDCDLRSFAFMPLDVARLRDSDIAGARSGDEFRAAVLLWCAAWHQVPAASLPNDDAALARFAGYGRVVREWLSIKEGALHGWVLCSDGRFYHPVVAEKALEAWAGKVAYRDKKERDRLRKAQARAVQRDKSDGHPPPVRRTSAGIPAENALIGTGRGTGIVKEIPPTPRKREEDCADGFDTFWTAWPKNERKQDKAKCLEHWKRNGLNAQAQTILADIQIKRDTSKWAEGFIEAPLVYLRGKRWQDGVTPDPERHQPGSAGAGRTSLSTDHVFTLEG